MQGMVAAVHVGRVQTLEAAAPGDGRDSRWHSGIYKTRCAGPVPVDRLHIAGDEQADLQHHGGPDHVVLSYAAGHYPQWREDLALPELPYGSFGENLTLEGDLRDETVCIGDIWRIGGVLLQVTQPRQPCWKLARRLGKPEIVKLVRDRAWGGWYSRVLQPGALAAGMTVTLVERLHPTWTIAAAARAMYGRKEDPAPAQALAQVPELSARWQRELLT